MYFLIFVFLAAALLLFLTGTQRLPTRKERRRYRDLTAVREGGLLKSAILIPLAKSIEPHIHLKEERHKRTEKKLRLAGIGKSPEEYAALADAKAALFLFFALAFLLLRAYPITAICLLAGAVIWKLHWDEPDKQIKTKQNARKMEVIQFMRTVIQALLYDSNLYAILNKYRETSGPELKPDLDILVEEMHTGNHEEALTRFSDRIGDEDLATFVAGLVSQSKGVDQTLFLQSQARETKRMAVETLKKEGNKKVDQLNWAAWLPGGGAMLMVLAALLIYATRAGGMMFHS